MELLGYCTANNAFITDQGLLYLERPLKHYLDNLQDYMSVGLGTYLQVPCTDKNQAYTANLHLNLDPTGEPVVGYEFSCIK